MLTARLRRLITASQRFTKSRQILQIHQTQSQSQPAMILSAPLYPLPSAFNDTLNPKMAAKIERQQRWEERVNSGTMDIYTYIYLTFYFSQYQNAFGLSYFLSSDGPGEKRLISTAWFPHLVLCLTPTLADSTGPSSGPWRGCTRRLTRAFKNTSVLLLPCVEGCVACHQKKEVRTDYFIYFASSSQREDKSQLHLF